MTALRRLAIEFACLLRRSIRKLVGGHSQLSDRTVRGSSTLAGAKIVTESETGGAWQCLAPLSQLFHRSRRTAGDRFRKRGTVNGDLSAITTETLAAHERRAWMALVVYAGGVDRALRCKPGGGPQLPRAQIAWDGLHGFSSEKHNPFTLLSCPFDDPRLVWPRATGSSSPRRRQKFGKKRSFWVCL